MTPPRKPDGVTLNLFDWQPPEVAPSFDASRIKSHSLKVKLAKALSAALNDAGRRRDDIAADLSSFLGEDIGVSRLNDWASEAKDDRNIPGFALIALISVLGSPKVLNALLDHSGYMVVSRDYEPLIERELAKEAMAQLERKIHASDAAWRAGR